jgi:hypothetical protein
VPRLVPGGIAAASRPDTVRPDTVRPDTVRPDTVRRGVDGGDAGGHRRLVARSVAVSNPGPAAGWQLGEHEAGRRPDRAELRHQGDALPGGDQRERGAPQRPPRAGRWGTGWPGCPRRCSPS